MPLNQEMKWPLHKRHPESKDCTMLQSIQCLNCGALPCNSCAYRFPCCGKRKGSDEPSIYCSTCHTWLHRACVGPRALESTQPYMCSQCLAQDRKAKEVLPFGINAFPRRSVRRSYPVIVDGSPKLLRLQVYELPNVWREPGEFTIRFNGAFSGLPYGFDDP